MVVSDGGEWITLNEIHFLEDQQTLVFISLVTTSEQFVESFVAAKDGVWLNGEPILSIWNMDEILAELAT